MALSGIRAIVFDLDSCLCAANEVGDRLFQEAFEAIRNANHGAVSEVRLQQAFADCWRFPFDAVATDHDFSPAMRDAGWRAFKQTEVKEEMHGYGDLDALSDLAVPLFLVTSGFRRLQESKIKALGIAARFERICIDAIDEPGRKGKAGLFQEILEGRGLRADQALVVGDNPDSEIQAGRRLGMRTVQILRPGVARGDNAEFHIQSLFELKGLLGA